MEKLVRERVMDCANYKNLSFGWVYRLGGRHRSEKGAGQAFLCEVSFTHWARLLYSYSYTCMLFDVGRRLVSPPWTGMRLTYLAFMTHSSPPPSAAHRLSSVSSSSSSRKERKTRRRRRRRRRRMSFPTWIAKESISFAQYLLPSIPFPRNSSSTWSPQSSSAVTFINRNPNPNLGSGSGSRLESETETESESESKAGLGRNHLAGHTSYLRCARCGTDLCRTGQIISKGFTGRYGRAYLVCPLVPPSYPSQALSGSSSSDGVNNDDFSDMIGNDLGFRSNRRLQGSKPGSHSLPNINIHKAVPRQLVTGAHTVSDISCLGCGAVLGWKYMAAEDETQRYKVGKYILETKRICLTNFWEEDEDQYQSRFNDGGDDDDDDDDDDGREQSSIEGVAGGNDDRITKKMKKNVMDGKQSTGQIKSQQALARRRGRGQNVYEDDVQFDSQDDDECDDLFAGVWSPSLALSRRRNRRFGRRIGVGVGPLIN